jgi:hypothetical protein
MEMTRKREQISMKAVRDSLSQIGQKTEYRLVQKGHGTLASSHEILGVVSEEYHELVEAVKKNDREALKEELLDIAVACHFAVACIDSGTLDW